METISKRRLLIVIFFLGNLINGCSSHSLPEEMPGDLNITLNISGGMKPEYQIILLKTGAGFWEINYERIKNRYPVVLSDKEMKSIYQILKNNRFDSIESRRETIYDRGGNSLSISFKSGSKSFTVHNSGMNVIYPQYTIQWNNIISAITSITETKTQSLKIPIQFSLRDYVKAKHIFGLSLNGTNYYNGDSTQYSGEKMWNKTVSLLPGKYILNAGIYGGRDVQANQQLELSIDNTVKRVEIYIMNTVPVNAGAINVNIVR